MQVRRISTISACSNPFPPEYVRSITGYPPFRPVPTRSLPNTFGVLADIHPACSNPFPPEYISEYYDNSRLFGPVTLSALLRLFGRSLYSPYFDARRTTAPYIHVWLAICPVHHLRISLHLELTLHETWCHSHVKLKVTFMENGQHC